MGLSSGRSGSLLGGVCQLEVDLRLRESSLATFIDTVRVFPFVTSEDLRLFDPFLLLLQILYACGDLLAAFIRFRLRYLLLSSMAISQFKTFDPYLEVALMHLYCAK